MNIALPNRLFLDVARSATGRTWRERLDVRGAQTALAMAQRTGISELLARVLAGRDVPLDGVEQYLDPSIRTLLPDPDTLTDMGAAVARLAHAVTSGEQVAVFGDYDVDGACATALMVGVLRAAGLDPLFHIPDRIFEGYGPNVPAIEQLVRRALPSSPPWGWCGRCAKTAISTQPARHRTCSRRWIWWHSPRWRTWCR